MTDQAQDVDITPEGVQQSLLLQQDRNNFELAKMSMQATHEHNKLLDCHLRKSRRDYMLFTAGILLLILGFCVVAMCLGKEVIALEVVKAGIFITVGGGAGYAIGSKKNTPPQNTP